MSDNQSLDKLIAQIQALGLDPATDYTQLPPHVRDMLNQYQVDNGFTPSDSNLQSLWQQVGATVNKKTVDASVKAATTSATKTGTVSPDQKKVLDAQGADTTGLAVTANQTPRWVLEMLSQIGGVGDPTPEQQKRIVDEWNTVFGTKLNYYQLTQLPQFKDPTDVVQKVVQSATLDIEPVVSYAVTLPGNRQVQISSDTMKNQFGLFGYKNDQVARIIRWADAFDFKDSTGNTAWQPLAALLKAKGLDANSDYVDATAQFIDPETGKVTRKQPTTVGKGPHRRPAPALPANDTRAAANQLSVAMVSQAYKQALNKYGDPTMAYLASLDSGLADRLMASGGDATKVSNADALQAEQYMLNGNWSSDGMHSVGYAGGSGLDGFLTRLRGTQADAGTVRQMPDPESLKQAVKDMWRKWFRTDPSDKLVAEMAGNLQASITAAPDNQSVDVMAQLRKLAEADPLYKTLYGNKQSGQTEEQYQQQFVAGAADILGNQAPAEGSITAGMRTGQYQTTIGSAAASGLATQNSTLLGRLATAAQIVNEKT